MGDFDSDLLDADVPEQAVKGLTEATRKALDSGRTVVLVSGDQLIRIGPEGTTVLKHLPPRRKVTTRMMVFKS